MHSRTVPVNERVTTSGRDDCVLTICGSPFLIVLTATELDFSACSSICGEQTGKILETGSFPSEAVISSSCCHKLGSLERSQKYQSSLKPYTDRKSTAIKVMVKRHVHALHTSLHRLHACLQTMSTIMFQQKLTSTRFLNAKSPAAILQA